MLRNSQTRWMKQQQARLLLNEEQEEIDGDIQNVFVRLFQCKSAESTRPTQTSCTDLFHGRVCGFDKHGACLNQDFGMFVI